MSKKDKKDQPCFPPVQDTNAGDFTPFNWGAGNLYSNPYWYGIAGAFATVLFSAHFIAWYSGVLRGALPEGEMRANLFILGVIGYWVLGFAIPCGLVWVFTRKRKKEIHD